MFRFFSVLAVRSLIGVFTMFGSIGVVLIELFGALGAIKLVAFTGNGGKRKGEEQDGEWFHRAA
ncbi:MAG: hypothetical protein QE267_09675 [Akkermansiaceae bacterium]|nr:hypothetical protein [Akkermansiaceae bacterium]